MAAAAAAAARASDVVQLTNANFNDIVAAEPALLVEFFAPCTRVIRSMGGRGHAVDGLGEDCARGRKRARKRKKERERKRKRKRERSTARARLTDRCGARTLSGGKKIGIKKI